MYSEWPSIHYEVQTPDMDSSVLKYFSSPITKEFTSTVVQSISKALGQGVSEGEKSKLVTDADVRWTMEIICHGLTLPLNEQDTIRDSVNIYVKWMSCFGKDCHAGVPRPIAENPNLYMAVILQHLNNLFVPRESATIEEVESQLLQCDRVLRVIESITRDSVKINQETWNNILKFLLFVCDILLSPPTVKDSIGDKLCDRVLSVLFEVWLIACTKCFPTPPYWKTLHELCCAWRHHEALVTQWHRINVILTSKILKIMYGPEYPELAIPPHFLHDIPEHIEDECIAQSWYRFLHIMDDPVVLSQPQVISSTSKFIQMSLMSETGMDAQYHPCLKKLPHIFSKAMKSVSVIVDAFLGISQDNISDIDLSFMPFTKQNQPQHTPPQGRKAKGNVKGKQAGSNVLQAARTPQHISTSTTGLLTLDTRLPYAHGRPTVNSVLHLIGEWLFNGALARVQVHGSEDNLLDEHSELYAAHNYDEGRAEAYGALCRIFCSKQTNEEILPAYLSRFYIALYYGLTVDETTGGHVLSSVIFNSCDLLRIDLEGVMILLPQILSMLEMILESSKPAFRINDRISVVELRKASIHLLLSVLCLPLQYKDLTIKPIFGQEEPPITFLSLKLRIIELLTKTLQVEVDPSNTQLLLGGLLLCVHDLALCNEAEQQNEHCNDGDDDCDDAVSDDVDDDSADDNDDDVGAGGGAVDVDDDGGSGGGTAPGGEDGLSSQQPTSIDSASGLFCHTTAVVCNRLMATWKNDLNIALPAIEVLSGLAKVKLLTPAVLMCKRTVNWLCEFIVYQCSRPAPQHSRDLHSMIVAAFQCLSQWLVNHEYLMMDKESLYVVLEVVELGISGSKSQPDPVEPTEPSVMVPKSSTKHRHDSKESKDHNKYIPTQNRASDAPQMKGDKTLKPVSLRVKDAAESLLSAIMDRVGSFPPPCGPESVCSLLDESSLLAYCCNSSGLPESKAAFRYFVLDGTTIIALLEQPLSNDQDPVPTVTAVIRGPFGRHAWTMQLRHLPRNNQVTSQNIPEPARPEPMKLQEEQNSTPSRVFPDIVDQIPHVKADGSVPALEDVMKDEAPAIETLTHLIDDQVKFESGVKAEKKAALQARPYPDPQTECKQPRPCHDFQTARLFLSHYGFLSLEALHEPSPGSRIPPSLVTLNTSTQDFMSALQQLDSLPCRTCDTVNIFYVKDKQKLPMQILNNVTSKDNVSSKFLDFLRSLGWPVDVKKHSGWTGHVASSWKISKTTEKDELYAGDTGGSLYDGRQQVLYWSDVMCEVAFVVPSPHTYHHLHHITDPDDGSSASSRRSSVSAVQSQDVAQHATSVAGSTVPAKPKTLELDNPMTKLRSQSAGESGTSTPLDHPNVAGGAGGTSHNSRYRRSGRGGSMAVIGDTKIFVVWLESYEDHENFPCGDFMHATSTGVEYSDTFGGHTMDPPLYIIYIHPLKSGLFRIHMQGHSGRLHIAIPLVDGMVVSGRSLGVMVRQTAINICRRKRLENESYQSPHVRRKIKIKEIVEKYQQPMSEAEFYTSLFHTGGANTDKQI